MELARAFPAPQSKSRLSFAKDGSKFPLTNAQPHFCYTLSLETINYAPGAGLSRPSISLPWRLTLLDRQATACHDLASYGSAARSCPPGSAHVPTASRWARRDHGNGGIERCP